MPYLTELIKNKQYKDLLLKHFPKPVVKIKSANCLKDRVQCVNSNSSLTGNSFEILFRLFNLSNLSCLENEFSWELERADANIKKLCIEEKNVLHILFSNLVLVKQSKIDYKYKIKVLRKILHADNIVRENKSGVKFIEIKSNEVIRFNSLELGSQIEEACGWNLHYYLYEGINVIIYDEDSLGAFYGKAVDEFREQCQQYLINRIITKSLISRILHFTIISSQFYQLSNPIKNIKFDSSYLSYLNNTFTAFNGQYKRIRGKLLTKPSLKSYGILATPDHIVKDKILELKTSQRFFSNSDYLQALSYLIFAQHETHRKEYGEINSVEIYYCYFNQSVKINIKEISLNNSIINEVKRRAELFLKKRR